MEFSTTVSQVGTEEWKTLHTEANGQHICWRYRGGYDLLIILGLALMTTFSPEWCWAPGWRPVAGTSSLEPNSTTSTRPRGTLHFSRNLCPGGALPMAPPPLPSWLHLVRGEGSINKLNQPHLGDQSASMPNNMNHNEKIMYLQCNVNSPWINTSAKCPKCKCNESHAQWPRSVNIRLGSPATIRLLNPPNVHQRTTFIGQGRSHMQAPPGGTCHVHNHN